ncbi:MAG: SWIM zinc finger family protein [Propionibacteriaceae bacterium]|nr:SWIM zinc finger family protein [Propionibacteriaceae bacterium]
MRRKDDPPLGLKTVEQLAPDQKSLNAAMALTGGSQWVNLHHEGSLWWGDCQGSGAHPYRAVIDTDNIGYKCTCPSRKFPCKHSLALMLIVANDTGDFTEAEVPQWVKDWMGRRRTAKKPEENTSSSASLAEVTTDEPSPRTQQNQQRRDAAKLKRISDKKEGIAEGLDELDQWISDQLSLGILKFLKVIEENCRSIAARLVDKKATALASRIDEMPARILALDSEQQPDAVIREFGKLVLISKAWRADPDSQLINRQVASAPARVDVLENPEALHLKGRWEVVGTVVSTRRDQMVTIATWFLSVTSQRTPLAVDDSGGLPDRTSYPQYALLLDYYPASAGHRQAPFTISKQYEGSMVFYPGTLPLRALAQDLVEVEDREQWLPWYTEDPLSQISDYIKAMPWTLDFPLMLPAGRIVAQRGEDESVSPIGYWWKSDTGAGLPLKTKLDEAMSQVIMGIPLSQAFGLWDGFSLTLLSAETPFGLVHFSVDNYGNMVVQ